MNLLDSLVSFVSPMAGVRRAQARRVLRSYQGAESNRLTANKKPKNRSADQELQGPFGADSMRAWSRMLVRDNAWASNALDSIVSETIGSGIGVQSMLESSEGQDLEDTNDRRDATWRQWCEVCELTGQLTFDELQALAFREMVEAGECLVHMVSVPTEYLGIHRPIPLALELIEADRLATDRDTFAHRSRNGQNRVVRGVEINELGKPVAYWVYPDHPDTAYVSRREPVRLLAANVLHLYRRDRIGQSRGISWFAPVVSWLRDLGVYVDNELQASAVASCFSVFIKTEGGTSGLLPPSVDGVSEDTEDSDGNTYSHVQPGMIGYLRPGEDVVSASPGRPNSASEPWINLMLRGIAAGIGSSYEAVSKDFSQTNYSSSRTSKLENRPRYRRWQRYWMAHLCQPVWDRFCDAAAQAGRQEFPTASELLNDRRRYAPVEFMPPTWEWVDVSAEQQSSEAAIKANQSTLQIECGAKGLNYKHVLYQRAKEEALARKLGLSTPAQVEVANTNVAAAEVASGNVSGEMAGLTTMQFKRNRKAIDTILNELAAGVTTEAKARVFLSSIGMKPESIDMLIADAMDGSVDSLPAEGVTG